MFAVKVTDWPEFEGFRVEETAVAVLASHMLEFTRLFALGVPRPVAMSQPGAAPHAG